MAKKSTDLATTEETGLAAAPSYLAKGDTGFESMQSGDLIFPRAALMQSLTPSVVERVHDAGDIVNSVTDEVICHVGEKRSITPVMFWHEYIEWSSRAEGGLLLGRSQDSEGELAQRARASEKRNEDGREVPAITEYLVFLVQPIDIPDPTDASQMFCICCARSNYKFGRKFLTLARMRGNYPLFAGAYALSTTLTKNSKGQFYTFSFANAGWTPEAVFKSIAEQYTKFKTRTISAAPPMAAEPVWAETEL
jgi:hypothetical protein